MNEIRKKVKQQFINAMIRQHQMGNITLEELEMEVRFINKLNSVSES